MNETIKKAFGRFDRAIGWIESIGVTASFSAIVMLVITTVFYRYVLKSGLMWSAEVQEVLIVALAMFGCARATRLKAHTELGAVVGLLPRKGRVIARTIVALLSLCFLVTFFVTSLEYTMNARVLKTIMLKIPYKYFYMFMPIGMGLNLYEFIKLLPDRIMNDPPKEYET